MLQWGCAPFSASVCIPCPFPPVTHNQSNLVYRLIASPSLAPLTQPHGTPLPSSSAGIPSVPGFFLRRHAAVPGRQCFNRLPERLSLPSTGSGHAFKVFEHILQTDSKLHFLHTEKDNNKKAATASPIHLIWIFHDAVDQQSYSLFPMCPSEEPNVLNGFWLARAPPRMRAPPGRTAWGPDQVTIQQWKNKRNITFSRAVSASTDFRICQSILWHVLYIELKVYTPTIRSQKM